MEIASLLLFQYLIFPLRPNPQSPEVQTYILNEKFVEPH